MQERSQRRINMIMFSIRGVRECYLVLLGSHCRGTRVVTSISRSRDAWGGGTGKNRRGEGDDALKGIYTPFARRTCPKLD